MRKRTRNRIIILVFIAIALYFIILNQIDRFGTIGGEWNIITNQIISVFPQIIGICLGFVFLIQDVGYSETSSVRLLLITGLEGIFFASLFYELNSNGVWIDEIITASFTITDLQIVTVLFFLLLGVLIGLIKR
ncbi:hypothetical protein ES702_00724 [subsurface metagenome]